MTVDVEQPTRALPPLPPLPPRQVHRQAPGMMQPHIDAPRTAWWHRLVALMPAVLALAAILPGLGRRQLWNDELATWHAASNLTWSQFWQLLGHMDRSLAEYYLIMRVWGDATGDSEAAMRLPAAIAMAGAAGLLVLVGRRLFNLPVGVLAGLIFAMLPVVSRFGQEARPYAFTIAAVVLGTLLLLRAIERPVIARWAPYTAVMVFAGWSHMVSVTILAAHLLLVLVAYRARVEPRLWWWLASLVAVLTAVIPLARAASKQSSAIGWIKADQKAVVGLPEKLFGSYPTAGVIVGLAVVASVVLWSLNRRTLAVLAVWALLPPLFTYLTFPILHLFLFRYLLFTVPAWCLLAAVAVYTIGRALAIGKGHIAVPVAAAVILSGLGWVALPGHTDARRSPVAGQPDYQAAVQVIKAEQQPGDGIAYNDPFGELSDVARKITRYELRDQQAPRDVFLTRTAAERGYYTAEECDDPAACLKDPPRLWLITTNYADPRDGMAAGQLLRDRYDIARVFTFERVRLALLTRKVPA